MTDGTPPRDPIAVHRGLLAIARDRKAEFNAILVQYAIERLLDRLSRSTEDRGFVLKGAMLFRVWTGKLHRPTRDVDFLGHGEASPGPSAPPSSGGARRCREVFPRGSPAGLGRTTGSCGSGAPSSDG